MSDVALQVKYKEKYEKAKGQYVPVKDTPQILHAKSVRSLVSEVIGNHFTMAMISLSSWASIYKWFPFHLQSKYKEASKKDMQSGSFTTLPETRDTAHSKEINKLVSGVKLPHGRSSAPAQQRRVSPRHLTESLPPIAEIVQSEVREGKGQVHLQSDDRSAWR